MDTKVIMMIIGIVVLMIMFPLVLSATHDIQTDEQTDAALALGGTPPVGTCTLTHALWNDDTDSVISATGDKPETLTLTSYTPATKLLTVGGVTTSTHAAIVYEVDALTAFTGFGSLVGLTPLLIWIGIIAALGFGIYSHVRK